MPKRRGHNKQQDKFRKQIIEAPGFVWVPLPHGSTRAGGPCRCEVCDPILRENVARWRRFTGATRASTPYIPREYRPPAKQGSRSCYNRCRAREEGPHPECRDANNEYQKTYQMAKRAGISFEEAQHIREHLALEESA